MLMFMLMTCSMQLEVQVRRKEKEQTRKTIRQWVFELINRCSFLMSHTNTALQKTMEKYTVCHGQCQTAASKRQRGEDTGNGALRTGRQG